MRRATERDIPAIDAFLSARIETSMFPLSNLRRFGLGGDHPRGMNIWRDHGSGGVLAVTNEGMVLPQLPDWTDWSHAAALLAGRPLIGCLGDADQVRALLAAGGLLDRTCNNNADEPLMALDLTALGPGSPKTDLRPLVQAPRNLVEDWRADYHIHTLGTPPDQAPGLARRDIATYIASNTHHVLFIGDQPVTMTGFNAICGDTVQIGGVYTPPALRGRGHAGQAITAHLREARGEGKRRAILFAASEDAQRVYEKIGFRRIGTYTMCLFSAPEVIR